MSVHVPRGPRPPAPAMRKGSRRRRPPRRFYTTLVSFLFTITLVVSIIDSLPVVLPTALASQLPPPDQGVTTMAQFLSLGQVDTRFNHTRPQAPGYQPLAQQKANTAKKAPASATQSVEPAKMQPLQVALSTDLLTANATGSEHSARGSDQRLEVRLTPGTFDLSGVTTPPPPTTPLPGQGTPTVTPMAPGATPMPGTTPQVTPTVEATPSPSATPGATPTASPTPTTTPSVTPTPGTTPGGTGGSPPQGLSLRIVQKSGHFTGSMTVLGTYEISVVDAQGQAVQGVKLRKPLTLVYHYQPKELAALGLSANRISLSWPGQLAAAAKAKQSTKGLILPFSHDKTAHTLTATTTLSPLGIVQIASLPTVQTPPTPHLASVSGNSGNLSYSYPLQLPPGPAGFAPQLSLNYSSGLPNARHSLTAPAGSLGDGWTLGGLGSISEDTYPDGSAGGNTTWYSLSGPDGSGDRLIPDARHPGFYVTQHLSHMRILQVNDGCFHVWGMDGTYYEYGCTPDSLEYYTDVAGTVNYSRNLNLIIAPREGPGSASKQITISYFQDLYTVDGNTSVRDAVPAQMVYKSVPASGAATIVGTVNFSYRAPSVPSSVPAGTSASWITAYGANYNCASAPPESTTLRCDDLVDFSTSVKAPPVQSTFSLQQITSYVGTTSANHPAYGYSFSYEDTPFVRQDDPLTQEPIYTSGEHLLNEVTPTVYQSGTANNLKHLAFNYSQLTNSYYDSTQTAVDGSTPYQVQTKWQYLIYYIDLNTNIGETISYLTAYSNMHGTPFIADSNGNILDDRHHALYRTLHASDSDTSKRCTGQYAHPDDHAWSVQVVRDRTALGKDSSSSALSPAHYFYDYMLAVDGTDATVFFGGGTWCNSAGSQSGQSDCTFDTFIPGEGTGASSIDGDWQDFYHGEFRGFADAYIYRPDGHLTVDHYYTTRAWGSEPTDTINANAGALIQEDIYNGTDGDDGELVRRTQYQYPGDNGNAGGCDGDLSAYYPPCLVFPVTTKTLWYEESGTGITNAPWTQTTLTYDDYSSSTGFNTSATVYHNLLQQQTTASNAPTVTKKWTYSPNNFVDTAHSNYVYYTVNKTIHSELVDGSGHIWQCQDTLYDEGSATAGTHVPAAGWATTSKAYSNCSNQAATKLTSYSAYDASGNPVGMVDPFEVATSNTSYGCSLDTAPVVLSPSWTAGYYTNCTVYDSYGAQPTLQQNVLQQPTTFSYDDGQRRLPIDSTDMNGQTTSLSYSYDSSGNATLHVSKPGETGSYTSQSSTHSTCDHGVLLPCFEIDDVSAQYPGAVKRTFYDSQGRETQTRTPLDSTHDLISCTVYNDENDTTFVSQPFRVAAGSGWIDPATATDDLGTTPTGTITAKDALGRVLGTKDALLGTSGEPGITCSWLSGTWSSCIGYGIEQPYGDSASYSYAASRSQQSHGNQLPGCIGAQYPDAVV